MKNYSVIVFIYIFSSFVFGNGTLPAMGAKVLIFLSMLICFVSYKKRTESNMFLLWNIVFSLFCFLSVRWSIDTKETLPMANTVLLSVICNYSLYYLISVNHIKLRIVFNWVIISSLIATLYYVLQNGFSFVGEAGRESGNHIGMNLNSLGFECAYGVIACFFNYKKTHRRKYVWAALYLAFFILLTGSRSALAFPIIAIGVWSVFSSPRIIPKFALISIVSIILIVLVIKIDLFYNLIGYRVESLLYGFMGDEDIADSSANTRLMFIELGWEKFSENPWLGFGLSTFGVLTGFDTYAHNNYVELLVGVGIVGTLIYYFYHLFLLFKLPSLSRKNHKSAAPLFLGFLIAIMITNYGNVSYFCLADNIAFTIIAIYTLELSSELLSPIKGTSNCVKARYNYAG